MKKLFPILLCLVLLFSFLPAANATEEAFTLVTSADQLSPGDRIIIVSAWYDRAMSVDQKASNRADVAITKTGNTISFTQDLQVITLEAGVTVGSFALRVEKGYLYAASRSANHLKTQPNLDANGSWSITIQNGEASIIAQGTNSRNVMQYHANSGIFSCYAAATQTALAIYKSASAPQPQACSHPQTELIPNTGNTHNIVCMNDACNNPIVSTEPCKFSVVDQGDGHHAGYCVCGNIGVPTVHQYSPSSYICFCGAVGYPGDTITIPQAKALCALLGKDVTQNRYYISGTLTEDYAIADTAGNTLVISGLPNPANYRPGDTVTLCGNLRKDGMVSPQVTSHTPYECKHSGYGEDFLCDNCGTLIPPPSDMTLTITQALKLGATFPANTSPNNYTAGKYHITGLVLAVTDSTYGTILIADEAGNTLAVNGVYDANGHRYDDMENPPKPGNTVTVYGPIGKYQSTIQMKNAVVTVQVSHSCDFSPATCSQPKTCLICGKTEGNPLGHDLTLIPATVPTQDHGGNVAHWSCGRCGKLFSDSQAITETTKEAVTLEKLSPAETEPTVTEPSETQTIPTSSAPTQPYEDPNTTADRIMIILCAICLTAMIAALLFIINRKDPSKT